MNNALVPSDPNALTVAEPTSSGRVVDDLLSSPHAFRNAFEMSQTLARSAFVPKQFQGKPEDILAALVLARGMGEDLFTVLNAVHFVGGKPGWSAPFLIARANQSGRFRGPIVFDTKGSGADLAATASATLAVSGERVESTVSLAMAKADGWARNAKYSSIPEQMLRYRAATFLIRLYCPEILFGYRPAEELEDIDASKGSAPTEYSDPDPKPTTRTERPAKSKAPTTTPPPAPLAAVDQARESLLARVKARKETHAEIVTATAKDLGLSTMAKASNAQLADLLDAVTERIEREAIQDEGAEPEGAQP